MGNSPCCRDPDSATNPEAEKKNSQGNHQIIGVMSDSFKTDITRKDVNRSASVLSNDAEIAQSISLRTVRVELISQGRPTFYDLIQQETDKLNENSRDELGLETQLTQTLMQDGEAAPTFQPKDKMQGKERNRIRRITNTTMTFGKSGLSQNIGDQYSNYASNQSRREASPPPIKTVPTEVEMEDKAVKEEYKESEEFSTDLEQTEDGVIKVAEP